MSLRRSVAGVAALGAAGIAWSLVEARWYTLREVTVPVLPAGQAPLRILHLSDLHLRHGQQRLIRWVAELTALDPHLVVSTGDLWTSADLLPDLLLAIGPHLSTPGAFVRGSNDYYAAEPKNPARYLASDARTTPKQPPRELPWQELSARLTGAGWLDLDNARGTLQLDGRTVSLVGTDDAHLDRDVFPARAGDAGTSTAATEPVDLHLGVTHAPYRRVLDAMVADGTDLILAGHTHGGQLTVPGYGALVTNCDLDTRRAKGLHGWPGARPGTPGGHDSAWLHVSAGLGTSPYTPVRFACRPEATLLTLTAPSSS